MVIGIAIIFSGFYGAVVAIIWRRTTASIAREIPGKKGTKGVKE